MMVDAEIKHKRTGKILQKRLTVYLCYSSKLLMFQAVLKMEHITFSNFKTCKSREKSCVKQKCLLRVPTLYCLQTLDLYIVFSKIKSLKIELNMWNYKKGLCLIAMILSDMFMFVNIFIYLGLYRYIVIFIDHIYHTYAVWSRT